MAYRNTWLKECCFVNGAWVKAHSGKTIAVKNPADQSDIGQVPDFEISDIPLVIESSKSAFDEWSKLTPHKRSTYLLEIATQLRENLVELSELMTAEQGKPLSEACSEIEYASGYFQWYGEEAKRIYGSIQLNGAGGGRVEVIKQPIGVVVGITPWNFPMAMLARKMAPALAAGCSFIAKPDEHTPFSALALGVICEHIGLPKGVVNIITGTPEPMVKALMQSKIVRKVSFTGSTEVGKSLIRMSSDTVKKLTLELGGNAPFIVFSDADIDLAIKGLIKAKFRNAGQTCIAVNRVFVESSIKAEFTEKLKVAVAKLQTGRGDQPGIDIGPLITLQAAIKVNTFVSEALAEGATLAFGLNSASNSPFVGPLIIENVKPHSTIETQEIFGPVIVIYQFETEAEVIERANSVDHGLASYVYTRDLARSMRIIQALEFGMVGINESAISAPEVPFGGVKESGFGREGGREGIEEYLISKYVRVG